MKRAWTCAAALAIAGLGACPTEAPGPRPPEVVILPYDAFGPQALAFTLIGVDWWQWEGGGSFAPGETFTITVVVHRDRDREAAGGWFPTVPALELDRRLVARSEALRWLDEQIAALDDEPDLVRLVATLRETRARIERDLPD